MEYSIDVNQLNGLQLAYVGDAVFELYIRKYVLSKAVCKVNILHKNVVKFTCGSSQAQAIHYLLNHNLLSEEEIAIFKRGRNSHVHTSRKNIDIQEYLEATGFEALIGYLSLSGKEERVKEIIDCVICNQEGVDNDKKE